MAALADTTPTPSLMDYESQTTQSIWEGVVPLLISCPAQSTSFHILARRCSYLPLILPKLKAYLCDGLKQDLNVDDTEIWFSAANVPLKWHYPIGLLYDIYTVDSPSLPWNITMNCGNFPSSALITMDVEGTGPNTLRDHFMAMIKEADYMRNGSIVRVMALTTQDQTQLWESIVTGHHDQFWQVNTPLVATVTPKSIPMRVYTVSKTLSTESVFTVLQTLVSPKAKEDDAEIVVGDMGWQGSITLHGVKVPLDASLLWLSMHAAYSDGFLHFVVYPSEETAAAKWI
ncbi:hypothetical protein BASA50_010338 [Batrachochytrium salamandrivorans]|uniref:Autophagy protein 5 n=1 Tax=Batrachochytrium salamandrivorans TaxID=1357716 RepID=A0ABQ8EYU0_9FUNG|nr:hypothetical protein BASA60_010630 [Batrachochytrium salamandrivorans]KAH6588982.1 hypothetical protein BASA50_010338 [Batrachochytrium salamandrivorans]KAH9267737.1 hypothetical protein BASA83_009811 [Batrachochytrium salamandrivorans]